MRVPPSKTPRRDRSRKTILEVLLLEDRVTPAGLVDLPLTYFLTDGAGLVANTTTTDDNPQSQARASLGQNAGALGLLPGDVATAITTNFYSDGPGEMSHGYYQQQYNGLPVLNTSIGVHLAADGHVLAVNGGFVPGLSATDGGPAAVAAPALTAPQAVASAAAYFGFTLTSAPELLLQKGSLDRRGIVSEPEISAKDIPTNLTYVYTAANGVRLAWQVNFDLPDGSHWYDVGVDAQTGAVIFWSDWVAYHAPTYNVYALPKESPLDGARSYEVNPAFPAGSPFGWHDTDGKPGNEFTDTRGNNVFAQDDQDANNTGGTRPSGGPTLLFDNPVNLALQPAAYLDAAVTNLFYMNNMLHDIHAAYGFTEVAGNFQVTNYTGQGLGNDQVQADAQDGSGTDNANFATPPDGTSGRMQMFRFAWGILGVPALNPNRDGDFDNGVVIHEYGHGVSNRVTGGPSNSNALNALQSQGMGEGWGDFWALMFTQTSADQPNDRYPLGVYVMGQEGQTNPGGIRALPALDPTGAPYSFDLSINTMTFAAFGTAGGQTTEAHNVGARWASTLWDLNWLLIDKYGFDPDLSTGYAAGGGPASAGNKLTLRLVMDALKLQPANPSFLQARDAILLADRNLTGGVNQREIWTAFARRGLGFGATTPSASSSSLTTSFAVPGSMNNPGVIAMTPAGVTSVIPSSVTVTFSEAMNPASFNVAADVASFTGPGGVNLKPTITGFSWLNSTTLRINFAAQTAQGLYTITLGPDIRSSDNDAAMDQDLDGVVGEVPGDQFTGFFRFDAVPLTVTSVTALGGGSTVNAGDDTIEVTFSEAVNPATLGTDDVQVSQGTVTGFTQVATNRVRYTLTGLAEGPLYTTIKYGAVADAAGFPVVQKNTTLTSDISTVGFIPLTVLGTLGWQAYQGNMSATMNPSSDTDDFTISLEAGGNVTILVEPTAGSPLRPRMELFDPTNGLIGTAVAATPGTPATLSLTVTTAGTYTVRVATAGGTAGNYTIRVVMNATRDSDPTGTRNDTIATAQPAATRVLTPDGVVSLATVTGKADPAFGLLPTEIEANNTPATANDATRSFLATPTSNIFSFSLGGNLTTTADVDWYNLGTLEAGDILSISEAGLGAGLGSLSDPFVELWRAGSATAVATDDDGGAGLDSFISRVTLPATDTYFIRARQFSTEVGTYQLGVLLENTGPIPATNGSGTAESEPNETQGAAQNVSNFWKRATHRSTITGTIGAADRDVFQYTLTAGDRLTTRVTGAAGFSPSLTLRDANGVQLLLDIASTAAPTVATSLGFIVPTSGTYYVDIGAATGGAGAYTLTVDLATTTPPPQPVLATSDFYRLDLTQGEKVTLGMNKLVAGSTTLDLVDAGNTVLAAGVAGATNYSLGVDNFVAPSTGPFYIRVNNATTAADYLVTVARGAVLDKEGNDTPATAQGMGAIGTTKVYALGGIDPVNPDWFSFTVATPGTVVVIETRTPGDQPGEFVNTLDPLLELYRPDGTLQRTNDNGAPDGRNAYLRATAGVAGTYRVRLSGFAGTKGEYVVSFYTSTNLPPTSVTAGGPYTITEGQTLTLVGSSDDPEGDPLSMSWDLNNDGVFDDATGETVVLTWAQLAALGITDGPNSFQVRVRASDGTSQFVSTPATVTVTNATPTATFLNNGPVPEGSTGTVRFEVPVDPSVVDTAAGFHYAYDFDNNGTWDLGDGTYAGSGTAATANLPAALTDDGPVTRTVKGRILDKDGGFTEYTTTITVTNVRPTATFTNNGPKPAVTPVTVQFTNPADPSTADAAALRYSYDFNNDGDFTDTGEIANSPSPTASVSFNLPGTYVVHGRISDKDGGFSDYTTTIGIDPAAPSGTLSNGGPVDEGAIAATVSFTNVTHPSPLAVAAGFRYAFDFDNDGVFDAGDGTYLGSLTTPTVFVPAKILDDGSFGKVIRGRVIEVSGGFIDLTTTLTVRNVAPSGVPSIPTRTEVGLPFTVTFSSATDVSAADRTAGFKYSYDFNNDGDFTDPGDVADSSTATVSYTAALVGTRTIRSRVTDKDGGFTDYVNTIRYTSPVKRWYATGADAGSPPEVRLYDPTGAERFAGLVFDPNFGGGVRVATGDVNGDGIPDVIVGTGPGIATRVRVISGANGIELFSVAPFEAAFTGGVYVAAGDINGDGKAEVVVTPDDGGGPRVKVYTGNGFSVIADFLGIDDLAFRGGARAALADINGDGKYDLLIAAGLGGGPRVAAYDGATLTTGRKKLFNDFFVFEPTVRDGVNLAGGDVDGDGFADVVVSGGPGGGPRVFILGGAELLLGQQKQLANFFAGNPDDRSGVRVTVAEIDNDDHADVVTGLGTPAGPRVNRYQGATIPLNGQPLGLSEFDPFPGVFTGVFVG